jgi:DNA-binding transcriptional LysR family regulator
LCGAAVRCFLLCIHRLTGIPGGVICRQVASLKLLDQPIVQPNASRGNASFSKRAYCFREPSRTEALGFRMHFDLTDLRLFVAVAEEKNLTRGAARQHLSLPAASARIRSLEAQAGQQLLVREARGVNLTPPGQAFLHHARGVLRQTEQLKSDLLEYGDGLRGHLRVLANTTAVTDFMPELLPAFLAANRQVSVDLREKPNAEIARGVRDGQADLGIVAGPVDMLGLESVHFSTDRLVLVTSSKHPLASKKRIAFAETLGEDAVGMQQGSTLQTFLARITEELGHPLKLRIQLSSFDAMCRMIGMGVGVGIVPVSAARRNQKAMCLALIELTDSWSIRERHVLMRNRVELPMYAQALVQALIDFHRRESIDVTPTTTPAPERETGSPKKKTARRKTPPPQDRVTK